MEASRLKEPEATELEPGATRVLTQDGWEETIYVDPDDDWQPRGDGSWESPDGLTRSWPLAGPQAADPETAED
jgi:hypothetical protein